MIFVKRAALLLLAMLCADAAPTAEECDGLNKTLPAKDMHTISGDWVLVWSVWNQQGYVNLLSKLSSSLMNLRPLPDNKTIVFSEWNMLLDKSCMSYSINISSNTDHYTMVSDTANVLVNGVSQPYNETGSFDFYERCSDCVLIFYSSWMGQYLLSYRREGQHVDVEQLKAAEGDNKKQAECLGFPRDQRFSYYGSANICRDKSSGGDQ